MHVPEDTEPSQNDKTLAYKVVLLDDHPITLNGIRELIEETHDLAITWSGTDPSDLWNHVEKCPPHLIVLDVALGNTDGLDLAKSFSARWPEIPILILSMHDEELYADRALKSGAHGYLMKNAPTSAILEAFREVARGELHLSDRIKKLMITNAVSKRGKAKTSPIDRLTDRELEVFSQIGQGYSVREIANRLGLSIKTIETYRGQIKEKLNIRQANKLVIHASEWYRHSTTPRK